nr:hypothetical protein B11C_110334 [Bartonella sp. 1-1C]
MVSIGYYNFLFTTFVMELIISVSLRKEHYLKFYNQYVVYIEIGF